MQANISNTRYHSALTCLHKGDNRTGHHAEDALLTTNAEVLIEFVRMGPPMLPQKLDSQANVL